MPQVGQIIPDHRYPHNKVVINDNTEYKVEYNEESDDSVKLMFVFASPKGRTNKLITIDGGLSQFIDEFGQGPFSLYGQPYLNAYNALSTGNCVAHCLRISAENSTYSYSNLVALYKIDENNKMTVKFKTRPAAAELSDLDALDTLYTAPTEAIADGGVDDGFMEVKLFTIAALGKGAYGKKLSYSISTNTGSDKENQFKNYLFTLYETTSSTKMSERFGVCFNDVAIVDGRSLFADGVIEDPDTGSKKICINTYLDGFMQIYNAYKEANPDTTLTFDDFDALLGVNKYTGTAIQNYEIDTLSNDAVVLNAVGGVSLEGGDDGDLSESVDSATRTAALDAGYLAAFTAGMDPYTPEMYDSMIRSKNKFPTNLILDANYPISVKEAMAALVEARGDCVLILDCGTEIKSKMSPITYVANNLESIVSHRNEMIDAICGKVRDPYSKKLVTVTYTCLLASAYPNHWAEYGGKHIPLAGNQYGIIEGFVKDSIYPIYDEDIDSDVMDQMADGRINFARLNALQRIVRATQTTRQTISSNLSEANNVFILLDIKRDCERLCDSYQYNFSEAEDIILFNKDAEQLLEKYSQTQVRSIKASFDKNDWEAERGILHLYIELEHKDLIKTTIIEIDVNRGSTGSAE